MKIDHPREDRNTAVNPVTTDSGRPAVKTAGAVRADEVRLSGAVRLVDEAVKAAALPGDIRPEAVSRARALLESGAVGQDLDALADRIIDELTHSHDDHH